MIRLAIVGYGNLGRGVETSIRQNKDMELVAVFTRRDPASIQLQTPGVQVLPLAQLDSFGEKVDVLILCGGSATDLPEMTPALAQKFNVVDSFDNHSRIPEHIANVHRAAKRNGKTAIVSCGWDPGMFSLARVYAQAALPEGETYTFWGPGLSQGHSDAVRRIPGVLDARQYTLPVEEALQKVRNGENPVLTTRQKHTRVCYVVAEEGADRDAITQAIVTMPAYFADYDTTVHFITAQEMAEKVVTKLFGNSFDYILGLREGIPAKPDPTGIFMAMKELGVEPKECAFVGDTGMDVAGGVNAGAFPIGVLWGFREKDELLKFGAKEIASTADELLNIIVGEKNVAKLQIN